MYLSQFTLAIEFRFLFRKCVFVISRNIRAIYRRLRRRCRIRRIRRIRGSRRIRRISHVRASVASFAPVASVASIASVSSFLSAASVASSASAPSAPTAQPLSPPQLWLLPHMAELAAHASAKTMGKRDHEDSALPRQSKATATRCSTASALTWCRRASNRCESNAKTHNKA